LGLDFDVILQVVHLITANAWEFGVEFFGINLAFDGFWLWCGCGKAEKSKNGDSVALKSIKKRLLICFFGRVLALKVPFK
jgi:hypothetical protein